MWCVARAVGRPPCAGRAVVPPPRQIAPPSPFATAVAAGGALLLLLSPSPRLAAAGVAVEVGAPTVPPVEEPGVARTDPSATAVVAVGFEPEDASVRRVMIRRRSASEADP